MNAVKTASLTDAICDNIDHGRPADRGLQPCAELGQALREVYSDLADEMDDRALSALRSAATRAGVTFTDL
jgi:predicted trehalose synthase